MLAYTGYDMEDSMIICKAAMERGFKHGIVYTTRTIDLDENKKKRSPVRLRFSNIDPSSQALHEPKLAADGLPPVGTKLSQFDPLYAVLNERSGAIEVKKYMKKEECVVEAVHLITNPKYPKKKTKATIKLRYSRNPTIGDKFASRAGQKV